MKAPTPEMNVGLRTSVERAHAGRGAQRDESAT